MLTGYVQECQDEPTITETEENQSRAIHTEQPQERRRITQTDIEIEREGGNLARAEQLTEREEVAPRDAKMKEMRRSKKEEAVEL